MIVHRRKQGIFETISMKLPYSTVQVKSFTMTVIENL